MHKTKLLPRHNFKQIAPSVSIVERIKLFLEKDIIFYQCLRVLHSLKLYCKSVQT